jgi:hypothetical protein
MVILLAYGNSFVCKCNAQVRRIEFFKKSDAAISAIASYCTFDFQLSAMCLNATIGKHDVLQSMGMPYSSPVAKNV